MREFCARMPEWSKGADLRSAIIIGAWVRTPLRAKRMCLFICVLYVCICVYVCVWSHGLMVMTSDFESDNRGSIPRGT